MDKEKLIIRLSAKIDTIKTHVNRLKKSGYNVHSIDVDMLRQKTIEFYEQIFELEKIINVVEPKSENVLIPDIDPPIIQAPVAENKVTDVEIIKEVIEEEKPFEEEVENVEIVEKQETVEVVEKQEAVEILEKQETFEILEEKETVEEPVLAEPVVVELPPEPVVTQPKPIIEKPEPVNKIEEEIPTQTENNTLSPQTTYDLFSGNSDNAVAEKFQANEGQSFADKMQKSSISNIREAIGINEKFLFINELFNGDLGRYNKILDDINDLPTKKGVDTYLLELKIQFQWADENEAYVKLKELLDRKFN